LTIDEVTNLVAGEVGIEMKGFLYENRNSNTFLIYKMQQGDELDTFSLGMVTNNKIPGLLPLLFTQMNDERQFMYNVTSKVSLRQYMSGKVTSEQCVRIFSGITDAILACGEYMLSTSVVLTDIDFIFMNVGTGEASLVCLPLAERPELNDISGYYKSILTGMTFSADGNMDYPAKIINALNAGGSFSLAGFRQFLEELQPAPAPDAESDDSIEPDWPIKTKDNGRVSESAKYDSDGSKHEKKGSIFQMLANTLGMKSGTKTSVKRQDNAKPAAADVYFAVPGMRSPAEDSVSVSKKASDLLDFGETTYLNAEDNPGETVLLSEYDPPIDEKKPILVRTKTGESITIEGNVFKIGKEKSYVSCFIGDNATVSRSHADIVRQGDKYCIVDNNSTNHTFINGQMIRSGEEILLEDGCKITLGNEEFEFYLR
jgi:hypothetical protein